MMDATETVILVSIFLLAGALIALPRLLARRDTRRDAGGDTRAG
jgi:hypothetical protein